MSRENYEWTYFFNRVEVLRNQINTNQSEFSKMLKITNGFYSDMKHGRSGPSVLFIMELFKYFDNLNPHWLFFGKEPQFLSPPKLDQATNNIIMDIISKISRLKPSKRAAIISIIEANLKLIEGP